MTDSDVIAKKTLWWTRWQTWIAAASFTLAIALANSTVREALGDTWKWIWVPQRYSMPGWIFLVFAVGLLGLILRRKRFPHPVTRPQPVVAEDETPFEYQHVVLWRAKLFSGDVYAMTPHCPHCPHCLIKLVPKESHRLGPGGGQVTKYVCDGRDCGKLKARFIGTKFEYEQRTKREIEAEWLRHRRGTVVEG